MIMESNYRKLALALSLNAVAMFFLTYSLIDSIDHFYFNINRIYMALLMVAPMLIVMLYVMRSMYPDKRLNLIIASVTVVLFAVIFSLARIQTPVGNEQFLRSMIPHHSSAILMCQEAAITDKEIHALCGDIIKAQRREIDQMTRILQRI